jgi:hypothetical protein
VVIAPHKRPEVRRFISQCRVVAAPLWGKGHKIKQGWGCVRADPQTFIEVEDEGKKEVGGQVGDGYEIVIERVRPRLWKSTATLDEDGQKLDVNTVTWAI